MPPGSVTGPHSPRLAVAGPTGFKSVLCNVGASAGHVLRSVFPELAKYTLLAFAAKLGVSVLYADLDTCMQNRKVAYLNAAKCNRDTWRNG